MAESTGHHLAFPFRIGQNGRTVPATTLAGHVRDELHQLLLTDPGERLFLPEFGGGLRKMVFEGLTDSAAAVAKAYLTQSISRWLGQRVVLDDLRVTVAEATVTVEIEYHPVGTEEKRVLKFERNGG